VVENLRDEKELDDATVQRAAERAQSEFQQPPQGEK
jgi:hypothetical protein